MIRPVQVAVVAMIAALLLSGCASPSDDNVKACKELSGALLALNNAHDAGDQAAADEAWNEIREIGERTPTDVGTQIIQAMNSIDSGQEATQTSVGDTCAALGVDIP